MKARRGKFNRTAVHSEYIAGRGWICGDFDYHITRYMERYIGRAVFEVLSKLKLDIHGDEITLYEPEGECVTIKTWSLKKLQAEDETK